MCPKTTLKKFEFGTLTSRVGYPMVTIGLKGGVKLLSCKMQLKRSLI
jgi:hypothetical protein